MPSRLDLHVHSRFSFDSCMDPKIILSVARKKRLAGVAIVDHNTLEGGLKALALADSAMFVIVGCELWTEKGEIIGLFLSNEIRSRASLEVIDEIKEQDGIAVLAHPCRLGNPDKEILGKVDAIEVFNARNDVQANIRARHIATRYALPFVGGSDAHFYQFIGAGVTEVSEDNLNGCQIRKEILERRVRVSGSGIAPIMRMLDMSYGYCAKVGKDLSRGLRRFF